MSFSGKSFLEQVRAWHSFYEVTRQVGHTHVALHGALSVENARIVMPNHETMGSLREHKEKGIAFYSMLKGLAVPVVFDNFTMQILLGEFLEAVDKGEKSKTKLNCIQEEVDMFKGDTPYTPLQYRDAIIRIKELVEK